MRQTTILGLLLMALTVLLPARAGAQVLRDADYNSIGRISGNGMVRDANHQSVGTFDPDGAVRDKSGAVVARIKRMEVFDAAGKRVGYINSDGSVRDGDSKPMGAINLNDGKVTDAQHRTVGYARGIRVDWIACYYLFKFFDR